MIQKRVKINELGMLKIPKSICKKMGIKPKSRLSMDCLGAIVVIRIKTNDEGKTHVLDELHRVLIPHDIREYSGIKENTVIPLFFGNNIIFIKHKLQRRCRKAA